MLNCSIVDMKYLGLNDIDCYKRAFLLSNYVWNIVASWGWFTKQTVGSQFARAVDSISANIAEGFGRYGKKDKIKFYYYGFGSVKESYDWNEKAKIRGLIDEKQYHFVQSQLKILPIEIHQLIKFTNLRLKI